MSKHEIQITYEAWVELQNIEDQVFAPLIGFMEEADYREVVARMRLKNGSLWPLPVTLDVAPTFKDVARSGDVIELYFDAQKVGEMELRSQFEVNYERDLPLIFSTKSREHPGLQKEEQRNQLRFGGPTKLFKRLKTGYDEWILKPVDTKRFIHERSWGEVTGFQTRNPIHRAHEHLQRTALEVSDGLLIHPLIGWKKAGDFTPEAVIQAYRRMIEAYYPRDRVLFSCLLTPMRYAGPREAVFHALIRRNFGCTKFIVGRDHAGVGGHYDKYAAQKLCRELQIPGVEILDMAGPFFHKRLGEIVTDRSIFSKEEDREEISGTEIRRRLLEGQGVPEHWMRPEIAEVLAALLRENKLFI